MHASVLLSLQERSFCCWQTDHIRETKVSLIHGTLQTHGNYILLELPLLNVCRHTCHSECGGQTSVPLRTNVCSNGSLATDVLGDTSSLVQSVAFLWLSTSLPSDSDKEFFFNQLLLFENFLLFETFPYEAERRKCFLKSKQPTIKVTKMLFFCILKLPMQPVSHHVCVNALCSCPVISWLAIAHGSIFLVTFTTQYIHAVKVKGDQKGSNWKRQCLLISYIAQM